MTKPLAIVHSENSCGWGGQEIRILTESRGFLDRGHRVTLVTQEQAPIAEAARKTGLEVVTMPLRRRVPDLLGLRRWITGRRESIDILNTHSSTDSWLGALACRAIAGSPPVVRTRHVSTTVHDNPGTRWLYRHGNAHIVTTGEAIRRQIAASVGVPMEQMTSIPTGIDLGRFVVGDAHAARASLALADRPTLGIVATMRAWKGHSYLFDALAANRAAWEGWQVLVVGGGPDGELLASYVQRAGLSGLVRFTGHQENVVPWLQSLDLFTLPSWGEEGVPQAIMQAMACGVPVVSTPVGAIGEAVEDGVTGLFAVPRSVESLAAKLAILRDDASLRARYSAASRTKAERSFGIDRMLDAMERVFRSVQAPR